MKRMVRVLPAVSILVLACFAPFAAVAGEEGRDVTVASCSVCHSLDYLPMNAPVMTRATWEKSIHKMVDRFGAPINAENLQVILDYLALHYSATP